ncbi:MAG TPA: S8 family serine peptidase [Chitinophagaceae bacterium]
MKYLVAVISMCFFVYEAAAQYPKLIVRFTDKNGTSFSTGNPSAYLSARAMNRRSRYNITIDSSDLPVSQRYIDSVLSKGPVTLLSRSKWLNQVLIQCTDQSTINKILALPFVKTVQGIGYKPGIPPERFTETLQPAPPFTMLQKTNADVYNYGNNYNQVHIHEGEFLHNNGFSGQGIIIAVLDAGFSGFKTIPAFDSIRINGQILGERDFVAFDNSVNEDDSHGRSVLSVMATNWPGQMVGTAPKANYWLIRTENAATEYPIEEHNWVVGAEFADSCGADLISSSLGYLTFDDPAFNHNYSEFYRNLAMVSIGATTAAKKGMIVVNSAGNEGTSSWKYIGFPADSDSVCAVGAVSQTGAVAGFSSYGYPGRVKPNIASVGSGTVLAGTGNSTVTGSGTSFACPNVAGLIACLWQAFPEFNNMQILDAVYKSCPTYLTPDDRIGFGIPNMRVAYQLLETRRNANNPASSWLTANPVPFNNGNQLRVKFTAPESGKIVLRMFDEKGSIVDKVELTTTEHSSYQVSFTRTPQLARGVYLVQYVGKKVRETIKVVKQ